MNKNIKKYINAGLISLGFLFPLTRALATLEPILPNPLATKTFDAFILAVSRIVINIGIPIAALFIIYAGLMFVTARGNEEKLSKARNSLIWAIIGTGVLIGARVIVMILQSTVRSIGA